MKLNYLKFFATFKYLPSVILLHGKEYVLVSLTLKVHVGTLLKLV